MMATTTTTTMATGDDNYDGDGQPFAPHERFLGLLARDSSRDSLQVTSIERLLARVFLGQAENATTNHERAAQWDTMTTTTMPTGDDDDNDNTDDGDGAAEDEVDNDGDGNNYGDGR